MKLTGAEIKAAIKQDGFLHGSGMKFTYESTKAAKRAWIKNQAPLFLNFTIQQ
jgi:hypothetical protein